MLGNSRPAIVHLFCKWRGFRFDLGARSVLVVLSEPIAFHEKAGRSQVDSCRACLNTIFSPTEWPLSPRFHPHSRGAIVFARCMLGVLGSAGAAICLAPCGSALAEWNLGQAINAVTGTRLGLLSFLFLERFCFYATAATVVGLLLCNGSYTSPLTHR